MSDAVTSITMGGAGKTGKGGIQVKALVLLAGVKIKKKVCTTLLDCEASQCL